MPVPAAQYIRVSTNRQQYSIENQKAAILNYAATHGFVVMRTYSDEAKSGLVLKNRKGMSQLLQDVVGGKVEYQVILVYDVSRWGRFQDADEAAHYEFLCKHAGIPVRYCAEPFSDDHTMQAEVMKALKRVMAAEYSRELSVKCFRGQKHLVELGFRVGAQPGYGLRRMMISADRKRQAILKIGEYKSLSTDRVVLVHGPAAEVQCVRTIYKMFVRDHINPSQIARELNRQGIPYRDGKSWPRHAVMNILTNAKYAGCLVWNRTSQVLHSGYVARKREHWIVTPRAIPPLICQATFDKAQTFLAQSARLHSEHRTWSDQELLDKLKRLLDRRGKVTARLISSTPDMPSTATYYCRFGGFRRIYAMIGYRGEVGAFDKTIGRGRTMQLRDDILNRVKSLFPLKVAVFNRGHDTRPILTLDNGLRIVLRICSREPTVRKVRWRLYRGQPQAAQLALICLLNEKSDGVYRFFLVPQSSSRHMERKLREDGDPLLSMGIVLDDLSQLYEGAICLASKSAKKIRDLYRFQEGAV
jgi:DNA invertase Pin-like site-specific DNA recombinase